MKLLRKLPKRTLAVVLSIVLVVVSLPLIGRQLTAGAVNQPLSDAMIIQLAHAMSEPDPDRPGYRRILPELEEIEWNHAGGNTFGGWGAGNVPVNDTTMFANNAPNAMWDVIAIYRDIMHHSFDRTIPVVDDIAIANIGAFIMPPSLNASIRERIFHFYPELEGSSVVWDLLGMSGVGEGNANTYTGGFAGGGTLVHNAVRFLGRNNTPVIDQTNNAAGGALIGGTAVSNMRNTAHSQGLTDPSAAHRHAIQGRARLTGRVTRTNLEMFRSYPTIESIQDTSFLVREMTTHMINLMTRFHRPFALGAVYSQQIWLPNGHFYHGLHGPAWNTTPTQLNWTNAATHATIFNHGQDHAFMVYDSIPVATAAAREALLDYRAGISRDGLTGEPWIDEDYLRVLSRSQLLQRQAWLTNALNQLPIQFAMEGGIVAPVMEHFDLPILAFGQEMLDLINQLLSVYLVATIDYASWFFSLMTSPTPGVIFNSNTPAAPNVFDNDVVTQMSNPGYDPREDFTDMGFTLTDLQNLYREAAFRRDRLLAVANDTNPSDFNNLVFATSFLIEHPFTIDIPRAQAWMNRLNSIIQRWEIWNMRDAMVLLIEQSANYSEGRNPNTDPGWTADPDNPNDPGGIFGDSNYTYCFDVILAWRDTFVGQQGFLSVKNVLGFEDYVEAITGFNAMNSGTVAYYHQNRLLALWEEIGYRETHYFSEARWYSFRDFFLPLMAESPFTHRSPQWIMSRLHNPASHNNAPRPSFQGVRQNLAAYQAMSAAASAHFGGYYGPGGAWYSIFGGFEELIHELEAQMEHALAVNIALYTRAATDILEELLLEEDTTIIEHSSLQATHPRLGPLYLFSWATMDELMRLVNGLGIVNGPVNVIQYLDPFYFLQEVIGDTSQISLPGYPSSVAIPDYRFLREVVWQLHQNFMNDPVGFHRTAVLDAPQRAANPPRDIRNDHNYNFSATDPGKDGLEHLINGLDALLTGNLAPFMQAAVALGLLDFTDEDDNPIELMGLELEDLLGADPLNVGSILQTVVSEFLFSNATVNMIVQMLYDLLLNEFEYIWRTEVQTLAGRGRIILDPIPVDLGIASALANVIGLDLQMYSLWEILNWEVFVTGSLRMNSLASLRLYPDLLARAIDPVMFQPAYRMLMGRDPVTDLNVASIPSNLGTGLGPAGGATSRFRVNMDHRNIYPTNAWNAIGSPHMFDADGNMLLDWGIDTIDDLGDREERFRMALSQSLSGLLPLLQALLLDRDANLHHNGPAIRVRGGRAQTNIMSIGGNLSGYGTLTLVFEGFDGYRNLVVPALELLLGEDLTSSGLIMNTDEGSGFWDTVGMPAEWTGLGLPELTLATREILDGILDPVNVLLDRIGTAPIATLIELLPNLAFAFSAQRIEPLLQGLDLVIDAQFNVVRSNMTTDNGVLNTAINLAMGSLTQVVANELGDMLPREELSLTDMLLGELDMAMLRSVDGLLGAFGLEGFAMPQLAQFASMGTMLTSNHADSALQVGTARAPGSQRVYIRPNRADVLNVLLQWVLGSGLIAEFLPENSPLLVHILQGTAEEMVAAAAQLAAPVSYAAPVVEFGPAVDVAYNPFPTWWARDGAAGAEQDARFLVEHADIVLGRVWTILTGQPSLSAGINELLVNMLEPATLFTTLADTVLDLLDGFLFIPEGEDNGLGGEFDRFEQLLEEMEVLLALVPLLVLTNNNVPFNAVNIINAVVAFDVEDAADDIDDMDDFVQAMAEFMAPLMPVLDILLFGTNIGLIDASAPLATPRGLVAAYGYDGFANALLYIYNAIALPLGIPAFTAPASSATNEEKMNAILMPIVDIVDAVLDAPVRSLLTLLPNIIFFMAAPYVDCECDFDDCKACDCALDDCEYIDYFCLCCECIIYSPLQQVLDALLHPLYVLLDTVRPIANVAGLAGLETLDIVEGVYFTNAGRLMVDPIAFANTLLEDLLEDLLELDEPLSVSLIHLMQGELSDCGQYFVADLPAVLFALLDQAGALAIVEESGFAGLTALIQNERFEDLGLIDYTAAPGTAAAATPPSWLTTDHVQFLADNVDAVLNWLWRVALYEQPGVVQFLEDTINDLFDLLLVNVNINISGLSVEETLHATVHREFEHAQSVFDLLVDGVLILRDILLNFDVPSLENLLGDDTAPPMGSNALQLLAQLLFVHNTYNDMIVPLCLDTLLFAPFLAYEAAAEALALDPSDTDFEVFEVYDEASAIRVIGGLFGGFMPLLNVFLAEHNALILYMGNHVCDCADCDDECDDVCDCTGLMINATNSDLDSDGAVWRIFGYDGYRTALLPIMLAFGGSVPGFVETLMPYDD
ncbi:MAG: hypothetical protein FWD06_10535, partial [Oscillospiraceae bacterium]|nr:hypothetical protein [Oscillospiraceae bacterium]